MPVAAIDQGTSSTRALVLDDTGASRIVAAFPHREFHPHPGWVEQDPLELLDNVMRCVEACGRVEAIGLANQGESCLAWDRVTLAPLTPVIVWQDQRTARRIAELASTGLAAEVAARAGLPLDCYFSATKLAWILEHSPAARSASNAGRLRLGTTETFLLECLTGVHATDVTTASRTSLMNLGARAWDPALCRAFGIPPETLAPIFPSRMSFGDFRGIPIRTSIVDQQASLYGHGCRRRGDAKVTFGTGAFALCLSGPAPPSGDLAGLSATVAWQVDAEPQYALEGGVYDAGAAIDWAMRIGVISDPSELHDFERTPAIERGIAFVPALSGLASPYWCRNARATWTGLAATTSRRDLQQSLLEGIALQTHLVLEAMHTVVPLADVLSVDGGMARNRYFLQFLADITGRRILRLQDIERTAYGCALMARDRLCEPSARERGEYFEPAISGATRGHWIEHYRKLADRVAVG